MESDSKVKLVRKMIMMDGRQVMTKLWNFFVRLSFYRSLTRVASYRPFVQQKQVIGKHLDSLEWHQDGDQEFCKKQPLRPSSLGCRKLDDNMVERQQANNSLLDTCKDTFAMDEELAEVRGLTDVTTIQHPLAFHFS